MEHIICCGHLTKGHLDFLVTGSETRFQSNWIQSDWIRIQIDIFWYYSAFTLCVVAVV